METVKNNEIVNTLVTAGVEDYTAKFIVDECSELESIEELIQVEVVDQVVYLAYKTRSNSFITAFDKRSTNEIWEEKTITILPDLFKEGTSLKEVFYNTLKLGSIEDQLFAAINNPDKYSIDDGDHDVFSKIMEFEDRIPESVKNDIISQVEEVNSVLIIKTLTKFYPKFGEVVFVKGENNIKCISLIGDNHIRLDSLKYDDDLIIRLFEGVEEPRRIQLLETLLGEATTPIKTVVDTYYGKINIYFKHNDTEISYQIGDTCYTAYNRDSGYSQKNIRVTPDIKKSLCSKAYDLLSNIEYYQGNDYYFFELNSNGKYEITYLYNDEED